MGNKGNEKKGKKEFIKLDAPNWLCVDCNYERYMYFLDKSPKKCPRCGGKNIVDLRTRKGID